jgi:hypothetical protein
MAARGSTVLQFIPSEVYDSPTPPENPTVGKLWRNSNVTPNELLAWKGLSVSNARSYAESKSGASVLFNDLSDNRALDVTVKTVASQAGSGTPSPDNIRTISGKASVTVRQPKKNLVDPLISGSAKNGVTLTYDPVTQEITLNGTCTTNNTTWSFTNIKDAIAEAHVLSLQYVSGTRTLTGFNAVQMAESGWTNAKSVTFPASGTAQTTTSAARAYVDRSIRVDAGSVFTNYKFKLQIEYGATATAWEMYYPIATTLTPDATLYGAVGQEDEEGNDGHVTHRTKLYTILGSESWFWGTTQPANTALVRFSLTVADMATNPAGMCSHFPWATTVGQETEYATGHPSSAQLNIFVNKARIANWSDAGTEAQKIGWFKTWLTGKNIQVVYKLATASNTTGTIASINGADGINTVTSDGASITVGYTGSGWVTLGSVERIAIEAVEITPEFGIKVTQILTDGTNTKNVYTQLYSKGLKIYNADTGDLIGGLYMQNGEVYLFASALADPRVASDFSASIETGTDGSLETFGLVFNKGSDSRSRIGLVQHSAGSTEYDLRMQTDGDFYAKSTAGWVRLTSLGDTGRVYLYGTAMVVVSTNQFIPMSDGGTDLGTASNRWKKVYAASSTISTSDERMKHDIHPADPEMLRKFIMALDVDWFRLNGLDDEQMVGFIAQKFRKAMLESGMPNDYGGYLDELPDHSRLAIRYEQIIAPAVAVLKLHEQENQERDKRIKEQGREIEELKRMVEALLPK